MTDIYDTTHGIFIGRVISEPNYKSEINTRTRPFYFIIINVVLLYDFFFIIDAVTVLLVLAVQL